MAEREKIYLGLLGYPLGHSLSPLLHKSAGESTGLDICYLPFPMPPHRLEKAIAGLQVLGFRGCNVTIPYKEKVIPFLDYVSDTVKTIKAVNTISFNPDETISGDNTDWQGFLKSWQEEGMGELKGKRVILLGAGGACRGILFALLKSGVKEIQIYNRNRDKAENLIMEFKPDCREPHRYEGEPIKENSPAGEETPLDADRKEEEFISDWQGEAFSIQDHHRLSSSLKSFDVMINTTPIGMSPHVNESPIPLPLIMDTDINPHLCFYDLIYNPQKTLLVKEMEKKGIKSCGGLGMLIHQAGFSFKIWTQREPDTHKMKRDIFGFFDI